jgi:Flp pilus assembly protein TadD
MRGLVRLLLSGMLLAFAGAAGIMTCAPAAAQGSYSPYNETATAALARYVRTLAFDPRDFDALIGAGRAALQLGDTQAAAGFFARADDVNSRSPLPEAGMAAVSVANGYAQASLPYFTRAQQLGATQAMIGCDRGLAYDLLGRQADAQKDYRAALSGPDGDEARRRLALSLAISGDKNGALAMLAPLSAKGDPAVSRTRAFILALSGDSNGAMVAIDAAMPGSWARVAPFLHRLPALQPGQKAAAVNLGIFPDASNTAYAYAAPTPNYASPPVANSASVTTDRLAGVDELLRQPAPPQPKWQPPAAPAQAAPQPIQVAYAAPVTRAQVQPQQSAQFEPRKIWLQLASGSNPAALPEQFERIKSKDKDLFDGIPGYIAKGPDRARLVVGPFRSTTDADTFAEDLESVSITAFKWTNSPSDQIVPLGTE